MDRSLKERTPPMQEQHTTSPFAFAEKSLLAALPKRIIATDEDLAKIKLPGYRYDAIHHAVLRMYEQTNACIIPLPILDIVNGMGCSIIPYRSFGQRIHDVLMQASPDAVTLQFIGSVRPAILYNDRQPSGRINFSILHEIGHIQLDHKEPSQLAELEANHFAAVALCPLDLLEHYNISEPKTVIDLFSVSDDCARNRLRALNNSRNVPRSTARLRFRRAVIERFQFKRPPQINLFGDYVF